MSWRVDGEGQEIKPPGGADATVWEWSLGRDGSKTRTVQVWITGTAMSASGVHSRVDQARRTRGRDEVQRVAEWEEPPNRILFGSDSNAPQFEGGEPGPEERELTAIAEWLDERGISLIFIPHGIGVGPDGVETPLYGATLYDLERDEVIGQYDGPTRLEAARAGRDAVEAREADDARVAPPAPAEAQAPAPRVTAGDEQLALLRRHHITLVWSMPTEGDPESGWMIEAYDQGGNLLDIAVHESADEALLTIAESLIPNQD